MPTTIPPTIIKTPRERFDDLINRVDTLYGRKVYDRSSAIKQDLENRFAEILKDKPSEIDDFVTLAEEIFNERQDAVRKRKNVIRQMGEIDAVMLNPEKTDIRRVHDQQNTLGENPTLEEIKNYDNPIQHIKEPTSIYRKNVMFAAIETQKEVERNMARFSSLTNNGSDLSAEEKKALITRSEYLKEHAFSTMEGFAARLGIGASEIAKSAGALAHYGVKQAGKGIISNSEAVDTKYNKEYNLRKEKLFNELKSKIDLNRSNASNMMQKIIAQLAASDDLLDINSYNAIRSEIEKEIKQDEAEYKVRVDKLNEDLQKAQSKMLEDMQGHEDKSDEMWKYRALSMFLVLTPFGAFSIAGHVFNYLDPLAEIFGPMFDASKTMGEGMGDVVTSDQFGFLGDLMGYMKVDVAIETIIDKTPIVSQFFDAINTLTDSSIGQSVMAEAAPLLNSPLLLLGIGGSYALSRAPEELKHFKDKKTSQEKHDKTLDSAFDDFYKAEDASKIKSAKTVSELSLKNRKVANIDLMAQKFFVENIHKPSLRPLLTEVFGGVKLSDGRSIFDLYNAGEFSDAGVISLDKVARFLNGDDKKDFKKSLRENFLLLGALDSDLIEKNLLDSSKVSETLAEFQRLSNPVATKEKAEKQTEAKKKFDQEFIFSEADRLQIPYDRNPRSDVETAKRIEVTLKEREIENLKKYLGIGNPSTVIPTENIAVKKLGGKYLDGNEIQ